MASCPTETTAHPVTRSAVVRPPGSASERGARGENTRPVTPRPTASLKVSGLPSGPRYLSPTISIPRLPETAAGSTIAARSHAPPAAARATAQYTAGSTSSDLSM